MAKAVKDYYKELAGLIGKEVVDDRLKCWFLRQLRKVKNEKLRDTCKEQDACEQIIADLNRRAGSNYKVIEDTVKLIKVLLNKGFTVDDFYKVNEIKVREWRGDEKMEPFIRPVTLYRASKFEGYLQQWILWDKDRQKSVKREKKLCWKDFTRMMTLSSYLDGLSKEQRERFDMPAELRELYERFPKMVLDGERHEGEREFQEIKSLIKSLELRV